jgi:hypothetical protein
MNNLMDNLIDKLNDECIGESDDGRTYGWDQFDFDRDELLCCYKRDQKWFLCENCDKNIKNCVSPMQILRLIKLASDLQSEVNKFASFLKDKFQDPLHQCSAKK